MEDRGIFNGRGFWALALLWLPAGVVAQALVRFASGLVDALGAGLSGLLMGAGSLVFVAPCGLPLALGCRRVWRLGYGGTPYCAPCAVAEAKRRDREREYATRRRRYAERRAKGHCVGCGAPSPGVARCEPCSRRHRESSGASRGLPLWDPSWTVIEIATGRESPSCAAVPASIMTKGLRQVQYGERHRHLRVAMFQVMVRARESGEPIVGEPMRVRHRSCGDVCGVARGRLGHAPDNPVALGSVTPSSIATFPMLMVGLSRKTVHQNNVDREFGDLRPVNTKVSSRTVQLPRMVVHLLEAKPRRMDGPRVYTGRDIQMHTIHPLPLRAFAAPHVWEPG